MTRLAVRVEGLSHRFGKVQALEDIHLAVPQGSVFGLLGPNGAGKTTTIRVLSTLLTPTSGSVEVAGFDVATHPHEVRQRIGLTGQYAAVDELLSGSANLLLFGRLLGLTSAQARDRAEHLLGVFDLTDAADRPAGSYSGGMRRRLDLAISLLLRPEVLFLDEPTTGLDPKARVQLWQLLRDLVAEGMTMVLTTQYLEEADQLADQLAVIADGTVIASGTPGQLKANTFGQVIEVRPTSEDDIEVVTQLVGRISDDPAGLHVEGRTVTAPLSRTEAMADIATALHGAGIQLDNLALRQPSLDEVFIELTGRPTAEATHTEPEGVAA